MGSVALEAPREPHSGRQLMLRAGAALGALLSSIALVAGDVSGELAIETGARLVQVTLTWIAASVVGQVLEGRAARARQVGADDGHDGLRGGGERP